MVSQSVICKFCHSAAVVKYGTFEGMQRYFCKSCRRKFADNDALPRMKTPVWVIASALSQYYDGKSLTTIQEYLNRRYGAVYAKSSIYNWVMRFSREALGPAAKFQPAVGKTWLATETSLTVGGRKIWLWDVVDTATGYLLDSSLSYKREGINLREIDDTIGRRTGVAPDVIITIKSSGGEKSWESVWYRSPGDVGLRYTSVLDENAAVISRFQTTLKTRRSVLRGFKNRDTANLLVATWQMHYNFFKSFTTLGYTPPGQNMPNPPFKNWLDALNLIKYKSKPPLTVNARGNRAAMLPPESLRELPLKGKYT